MTQTDSTSSAPSTPTCTEMVIGKTPECPSSFKLCGCKENGYDNVRVVRGQMTIRCRGCEHRVKAATKVVKSWRCQQFWLKGACPLGDECPKLHLYFRKRNLQQRIDVHGEEKLSSALAEVPLHQRRRKSISKDHVLPMSHALQQYHTQQWTAMHPVVQGPMMVPMIVYVLS
eukprot:TRINITY_DN1347_c0_g1_i5.p1 TRINITY_DN1347_c0_g1~~TRINITY_DN1347_c0_g1_i5.p1  ORF type:complete len:172 (+),score=29.06 TRINITY_DN1347_c0_g1_i5:83-598(+)